jgi:hypothetical protein
MNAPIFPTAAAMPWLVVRTRQPPTTATATGTTPVTAVPYLLAGMAGRRD